MAPHRRAWVWLALALCAASMALACSADPSTVDRQNGQQQSDNGTMPEVVRNGDDPPPNEYEFVVTSADVGEHLEATTLQVGLPLWLAASADPMIAGLPQRVETSSGVHFQPGPSNTTGEIFWLHVFTDESSDTAATWVKYLASQPPSLARFTVERHELFAASFRPTPVVGDAAVSIELLHGHSGGCWRSELLIFAKGRVLVFLKTAIEITRDEPTSGSLSDGTSQCDEAKSASQLTDIEAIAHLVSDRLY